MATQAIAPRHGERLVDARGVTMQRPQAFFDELGRLLNDNISDIAALDVRVTALEPIYVTITSADSPYQALDMQYIDATMDGNISILVPTSGRLWVYRDGASNTLTMTGTINGVVNPTMIFDGTARTFVKIGVNWRVMR